MEKLSLRHNLNPTLENHNYRIVIFHIDAIEQLAP